jgi:Pyruvate/2-oxoacid:ferredoxin oxidoreductase delta subunit
MDAIKIKVDGKKQFATKIDLKRCIGCGVCEHECPVKGLRAIRVTAENESRNPAHGLLLP